MKIMFCGASMDVTGSCHMITTDSHKILQEIFRTWGSNPHLLLGRRILYH